MIAKPIASTENDPIAAFEAEKKELIKANKNNVEWQALTSDWMVTAIRNRYCYNFSFLGRPIIQMPQDMVAVQEIIWSVKPDLIIETGIAHGGSLIMSAGMLAMIDYCEAIENGTTIDPKSPKRRVLGIDIDIRAHNRKAIEAHPLSNSIDMIQGSSIDPQIIQQVKDIAKNYKRVLVSLDSNHTHDHVLAELQAYAPLTSKGSYCIVFDTHVEDMPEDMYPDRPWGKGNNPRTAVREYLNHLKNGIIRAADGEKLAFDFDYDTEDKLLTTVSPDGFLKRI